MSKKQWDIPKLVDAGVLEKHNQPDHFTLNGFGYSVRDMKYSTRFAALIQNALVEMVLAAGGCIQTSEVPTLDGQHYAIVPYGSEGLVSYYPTLREALQAWLEATT